MSFIGRMKNGGSMMLMMQLTVGKILQIDLPVFAKKASSVYGMSNLRSIPDFDDRSSMSFEN